MNEEVPTTTPSGPAAMGAPLEAVADESPGVLSRDGQPRVDPTTAPRRAVRRGVTDLSAVRTLSEIEKAWLAGVIDCEGSVGLYRMKEGRRVVIQVANTHRGFIERVKQVIGCGCICPHIPGGLHIGKKTVYHYICHGSERGIKLLTQVRPYLIIKGEKTDTILNELRSKPFGRWAAATPEARQLQGERMRRSWKDPATRQRRVAGMKAYQALRRAGVR